MDTSELLGLVSSLNRDSAGADDEVAGAQKMALNYYFQRARGDEQPGRSQYVSGDVSAMVEANLAAMMESFTTDNIAEFKAFGAEDEDQAQLESDVVSYYIMDLNRGYWIFQEGIKDALLLRNGLIKVYPEKQETTRTRTYENVNDAAYAGIVSKPGTVVIAWDPDAGELKVRETSSVMTIKCEGSPIENFRYTKNWTSIDLQNIPYCAERQVDLRSDLLKKFPDKKADIQRLSAFRKDDQTTNKRNPQASSGTRGQVNDPSLDEIEWWESYVLVDKNGDGIAERHRVSFVEHKLILDDEETDLVCFGAGTAIINPHRFLGVSLFDKLKQTQDLKTGFRRAGHDNANVANKSRTAYLEGKVDDEDLENGLVDGNIRVRGVPDVRAAMMAFTNPDIGASIRGHVDDLNRERAEMGGAALDMSNANVQLSDRAGSQGIDRAYSVMEQLASMMTRNVAQSLIRATYLLTHATLRSYVSTPIPIKRNGRWAETNPRDWPERKQLSVKLGMSSGERTRRAGALGFILQAQMGLADKGYDNILVNIEGFYQALTDWARVSDIPNPEQYFVDPSTDASKEALKGAQEARAQEKKAQQKLTDVALALEQLRISVEKNSGDADRHLDWSKAQLSAAVEEMKVVGAATTALLTKMKEKEPVSGKADESRTEAKGG